MMASLLERLLKHRIKVGNCWEWTGAKNNKGYGQIKVNGKVKLVSRISWMVFRGPVPNKKCVLHRCDNPPCFKPYHLFLGTQKDNGKDSVMKGRRSPRTGENNTNAKLTSGQVEIIRNMRIQGFKLKRMSATFGVNVPTISKICNRHLWK
jgi:HNH endonuclease